jgi:hypothetical protein
MPVVDLQALGSDHRPYRGGLPQRLSKAVQAPVAQRTELPHMQRLHRGVELIEQLAPLVRDGGGDDTPVRCSSGSPRQVVPLEAIEKPSDVRVAGRGALRHRAERSAGESCVAENPQHVILLRSDAVGFEQRGELANELSRGVLEQEVEFPLRRFDGLESPRPSG